MQNTILSDALQNAAGEIEYSLTNDYMFRAVLQTNEPVLKGLWTNRSLSYLCRSFDQLERGSGYDAVHPVIHIGILDYTLFDDAPEFYAENMLMNTKNHKVFNDRFILNVLCLNQTGLATDEDRKWQTDRWAALFKAHTWEEIRMVSENNEILTSAAESLYRLAADNMIREQCRAREDYEAHERNMQRKLEEKDRQIAELKRMLLEKA